MSLSSLIVYSEMDMVLTAQLHNQHKYMIFLEWCISIYWTEWIKLTSVLSSCSTLTQILILTHACTNDHRLPDIHSQQYGATTSHFGPCNTYWAAKCHSLLVYCCCTCLMTTVCIVFLLKLSIIMSTVTKIRVKYNKKQWPHVPLCL